MFVKKIATQKEIQEDILSNSLTSGTNYCDFSVLSFVSDFFFGCRYEK